MDLGLGIAVVEYMPTSPCLLCSTGHRPLSALTSLSPGLSSPLTPHLISSPLIPPHPCQEDERERGLELDRILEANQRKVEEQRRRLGEDRLRMVEDQLRIERDREKLKKKEKKAEKEEALPGLGQ